MARGNQPPRPVPRLLEPGPPPPTGHGACQRLAGGSTIQFEGTGPLALGHEAERQERRRLPGQTHMTRGDRGPWQDPSKERGPMLAQFMLQRSERAASSGWPGSASGLDGARLTSLLLVLLVLSAAFVPPAGAQPPEPRVESAAD